MAQTPIQRMKNLLSIKLKIDRIELKNQYYTRSYLHVTSWHNICRKLVVGGFRQVFTCSD
jgi:hypothetical protein